MADLEFVNPSTGAALGAYAFGTIAAGTASAAYPIRLRYKWGQSGSGLRQNAVVLEVSDDGGVTWGVDTAEFTLAATAALNPGADPLFAGTALAARRTNRLNLAPLRAGCGYDLSLVFSPTLRTGAATTTYTWRLGVLYNEGSREISLNPGLPTGVLTGLGDIECREWIIAPTLTEATAAVNLGFLAYDWDGGEKQVGAGPVALDQGDGDAATLGSGEEYVAVLSVGGGSGITVTKGSKAPAGDATTPAYPSGELAVAVVRVPYGGVITTATLVATSGRLVVTYSGSGRTVYVGQGRAQMPGYLIAPQSRQSFTFPGDATYELYISRGAALNRTGDGMWLASVTCAGGVVTDIVDRRVLLYQGLRPRLYTDLDADGYTLTNVQTPVQSSDPGNAAPIASVWANNSKPSARVVATTNQTLTSNLPTIDGVTLTEDQVALLTGQTAPKENGLWQVRGSSPWLRLPWAATAFYLAAGAMVYVREGTAGAKSLWLQTLAIDDIETDAQEWRKVWQAP